MIGAQTEIACAALLFLAQAVSLNGRADECIQKEDRYGKLVITKGRGRRYNRRI